ncbi:MAG TPA: type VI secretion system tip protein VgrG, partial [Polyangiaceae bacterium]|nr:type VI secretion system tip protein VgrG [Polyangiaceae bacterium]
AFSVTLSIVSKLALLRLGRDHRIFQEKSVSEVVDDVLGRAGLADLVDWSTNTTYEPHKNIVQYAESDLSFVQRLLAEEGIGYANENDDAGEHIVFFDDDTAHQPVREDSLLRWIDVGDLGSVGIEWLEVGLRRRSDQVMQNDYDLARPAGDLRTTAEAPDATAREVYSHPGSYIDSGRGQRLTDRLLEQLRVDAHTMRAATNVIHAAPGHFFTASGAARSELDRDYLITEVRHRLSVSDAEGTYDNTIRGVPLEVAHRPTRPPSVAIPGVQHALVTVPGGEEIHADEHGRSKVRFLWDRSGVTDDKSSTWLRVGQLALGGSMILPRVDFEVLVDLEMGDLDRPAISGHLYNAELAPPYALPEGCTVSSLQTATTGGGPGANELRFEDSAGGEEVFINASKDMTVSVENDTTWQVGNNQCQDVGSNASIAVTSNHDASVVGSRSLSIGANQDINVAGELGDGTGGALSLTIGANRMIKAGGDHTEDVGGALSRSVGSLQSLTGIAGYARTVTGNATIDVGAVWAEICGAARGTDIKTSYTETVGALKFIKAKNLSVNCDGAYVMKAAAELIKAGGGRTDDAKGAVALTAGAAFQVKATNIVFEAKSKLVFRGGAGVIELTKSGGVTVKAPSVRITNSEALNQLVHKSG